MAKMKYLEISDKDSGEYIRCFKAIRKEFERNRKVILFSTRGINNIINELGVYNVSSRLNDNGLEQIILLDDSEPFRFGDSINHSFPMTCEWMDDKKEKRTDAIMVYSYASHYFSDYLHKIQWDKRVDFFSDIMSFDASFFMMDFCSSVFFHQNELFDMFFDKITNSYVCAFVTKKLYFYENESPSSRIEKINRLISAFDGKYESYFCDMCLDSRIPCNNKICKRCGLCFEITENEIANAPFLTDYGIHRINGRYDDENNFVFAKDIITGGKMKGEYALDGCPYKFEHELASMN